MAKEAFGEYIRQRREKVHLPLRKVAAQLNIDTSTLNKVERGKRPMPVDYLKPLSHILHVDCKELQVQFLADTIEANYVRLEYLKDGLEEVLKQITKKQQ